MNSESVGDVGCEFCTWTPNCNRFDKIQVVISSSVICDFLTEF